MAGVPRGARLPTGTAMRRLRKQPRSREVRRQGAPRATRFSPKPPRTPTSDFFVHNRWRLGAIFKPISHEDFSEWPTGRPAGEISLCIRRKPSQTKARPRCAGYCAQPERTRAHLKSTCGGVISPIKTAFFLPPGLRVGAGRSYIQTSSRHQEYIPTARPPAPLGRHPGRF